MFHTVNRAPVQAIRPNLPHYHIDQTLNRSLCSNCPLTLSDIADNATWNWIRGDPYAFFNAFLTDNGTRVLDCEELLRQEYLQRTARRVCP
jgi:hypothetical protein